MKKKVIDRTSQQWIASIRQDLVIQTELLNTAMTFKTTWGLFSPKAIDAGSLLLLDYVNYAATDRILDLGCGYGPIGLSLAKHVEHCTLVDKDFVAIEYTKKNAEINQLDNVNIQLSDGLKQLDKKMYYSLIVTNLPAKTSKEHYYLFFYDALAQMNEGAKFYVVVISGLRKFIARAFVEVFGNHTKIKQGRVYTVAMAEKRNIK